VDLRIAGTVIDLDPKTKVRVVRNNTMFVDDFLDSDFTYPFFIPGTEFNKKFFKHPEKPESVGQPVTYENVEVRDEGQIIIRGTLYLQRAADEGYQAYLLAGMGELAAVKDLFLKDVDLGGVRGISTSSQEITFTIVHPGSAGGNLTFLMWGVNYVLVPWGGSIPGALSNMASQINAHSFYYSGTGPFTLTATTASHWIKVVATWSGIAPPLTAYLYFTSPGGVITSNTGLSGATAVKDAWEDLMNEVTDVASDSDYLFFPVLFREPHIRDITVVPAVIFDNFIANYAENGEFIMDYKSNSVQTAPLPFVKMLFVLKQILRSVSFSVTGSFITDYDIKNMVLFNNKLLLTTPFSIVSFDTSPYESTFDLKNHVPQQKTISEFLTALRKCFAIAFYFDTKTRTAEILTLNEMLDSTDAVDYSGISAPSKTTNYETQYKGYKFTFTPDGNDAMMSERVQSFEGKIILPPVVAYADLAALDHSKDNICYVEEENAYYYPEYDSGSSAFLHWSYYSDNLNELDIDDAETEINPGSDTLVMFKVADDIAGGGKTWRIPVTKMLPNVPDFFQEGFPDSRRQPTETGIRFLFFRGWEPDSLGADYPLGSHDDILMDGSVISPLTYEMQWDGPNGLYIKAWAKFTAWMREAREVEMDWFFTHLKWQTLDMRKKAFVNGVHYFIKSVDQEFPITAPAKVVLMKVGGGIPDSMLTFTRALRITFDDIANVPVGDATSVSDWNTFFDLPANGGEFTAVIVSGNEVQLTGGSGITVAVDLFSENEHITAFIDDLNCIDEVGDNAFGYCPILTDFRADSATVFGFDVFTSCELLANYSAIAATEYGSSCFAGCIALISFIGDAVTSFGGSCFNFCSALVSFSGKNATQFGSFCFANCTSIEDIDMSACTDLGGTTGNESVFSGISGNTIALKIKSGTETDGDVTALQGANTVTLTLV
jgi:hypothetical protein